MARTIRLFVAVYPPAAIAPAMLDAARACVLPAHRLTDAEQLHMTLVFIGERRAGELGDVIESVDRACAGIGAMTLTPTRVFTIPTPSQGGPARLLALGTDAPGHFRELQRRLATRLARADEKRKAFEPHITLARFAPGQTCQAIDKAVELGAFSVDRVRLMQSVQTRERAEHRVVFDRELTG
jgi:2'-5' RNA ligase